MTLPDTITTEEVQDLEFVRIADDISHKWAEWEVRFTYEGHACEGFVGACPRYPNLMHDDNITNCILA